DGTLLPEPLHHVPVVDDLPAHVDGHAHHVQGPLDDLDGALHARAEPPRAGEHDLLEHPVPPPPRPSAELRSPVYPPRPGKARGPEASLTPQLSERNS